MKYLALILVLMTNLVYADEILKINRDHSFIKFQIPYMAISEVEGQFRRFEGKMILSDSGEIKSIELIIDSSSIDTNNKIRDAHLKESSFLYVEKHPRIQIDYKDLAYNLTIKDNNISSRGELPELIKKQDTWGKTSYFQKITKKLPLKGFNFKWNKTLPGGEMLLGDDIIVTAVFQWQDPNQMTAASKHRIPDTKTIRKIRFQGERYQGLEPEMVSKRAQSKKNVSRNDEKDYIQTEESQKTISLYIMFILGFIGLIGFYLVSRLALIDKKRVAITLDIVFISILTIYLLSSWSFLK